MTAPLDRLQQLEEAVAKGKPGPWRVSANGEDVVSPTQGVVADAYEPADAALIVAAVNALGPLTAAVREFAELEASYPLGSDVPVYRIGRILARLAAALDPAHDDERQNRG